MTSKPTMDVNGGVYLLRWKEEMVAMKLDRIRESQMSVTAELTVGTTRPGIGGQHLHQARATLTSTQARAQIAGALRRRVDDLDWDAMIEQACVMVLQNYRQGEPVIQVGNLERREQSAYLVWPLLRYGEPTLIYADGGSGKSTLAAMIGLMVQSGHPGMANMNVLGHGNVLYLDYEASFEEVDEHVKQLRPALRLEGTEILYRFCYQPLADEVEEIQHIVSEQEVSLLIVDSLALACGGEPEKTENILPYYRALRSLRKASMTLHHVNKEDKFYGNSYLKNMSRSVWRLRKTQEAGADELVIGLYHDKVNRGKLIQPIGLRFRYDGVNRAEATGVVVEPYELLEDPGQAANLPMKDRIAALLKTGKRTVKEIAEEVVSDENSVRTTLNRHKGTLFQPFKDGSETYWGMSAFQREDQRW